MKTKLELRYKIVSVLLILSFLYYPFSILTTGSFIQYDRRIEHRSLPFKSYELTIHNQPVYEEYFKENFTIYHQPYSYKKTYGIFHLFPKIISEGDIFTTKFILSNEDFNTRFFIQYNKLELLNLHTDLYGYNSHKNAPVAITLYSSDKKPIFTVRLKTNL